MYKKIKNGSFMNWIWFIICIAPILLIFIYTLGFFDNEKKEILIEDRTTYQNYSIINENNINSEFSSINLTQLNTNNYTFELGNINSSNLLVWNQTFEGNKTYRIYIKTNYDNTEQGTDINFIIYDENIENALVEENFQYNNNNYYTTNFIFQSPNDINTNILISLEGTPIQNTNIYLAYFIQSEETTKIFTNEELIENNNYYRIIEINDYIQPIYSNYEDYLKMINNTLKTNGFISNAFLNLSQFFGITNVYYSIACYYIEYLLVIILLHLAFDLLYIVPNICHKFMEKIGGERD